MTYIIEMTIVDPHSSAQETPLFNKKKKSMNAEII